MTVTLSGDRIRISGAGRIEDAETLVVLLQSERRRIVDLSEAEALHTAVVQVLLAFRPDLVGSPDDLFCRTWILPVLPGDSIDPAIVTVTAVVAEAVGASADGPRPSTPSEET